MPEIPGSFTPKGDKGRLRAGWRLVPASEATATNAAGEFYEKPGQAGPRTAPADYQWGYNRMTTVQGLFGAGDTIGGSAHKFSAGSFTEGGLAGKAAVRYVMDMKSEQDPDNRVGDHAYALQEGAECVNDFETPRCGN